jgi:hypothetical protein
MGAESPLKRKKKKVKKTSVKTQRKDSLPKERKVFFSQSFSL